jgi:dTDP-4-dehydrorhamnose 3,5-epimerase
MSTCFDVLDMPVQGLRLVQRRPIRDGRGYLERMFCTTDLESLIPSKRIVQINHTLTARRGTVRGMHFQRSPYEETKFVSCLRGKVFDVAVDLRQGSTTFLFWHAEVLSAANHRTLFIPEGFAHGFQTLTTDCEMLYLHTANYQSDAEGGLNARDPRIGIRWPLPIEEQSERDSALPLISENFGGLVV